MSGPLSLLPAAAVGLLHGFDVVILVYFVAVNSSYLMLVLLAARALWRHLRRSRFVEHEDSFATPTTRPVSLVVPAYDEAVSIVASVRALLALHYPSFEVIVVDDGSRDATFDRLASTFDLVPTNRVIPCDVPVRAAPDSVHVPRDGRTPLVVVRKQNSGCSDSLNVGINVARFPLVGTIDADSILDRESLLRVTRPFLDDPERVVATGGVVRAVNGCQVVDGAVIEARMPRRWLARIQVIEYLRAFMLGRVGWSSLGSLVLISGAFGLFRRDVVVGIGGFDADCVGQDFEIVTRIHRLMRQERRDYRVVFVAEPVAWTEVPSTARVLARQRRRWHRGLWEVLRKHRAMLFNPCYGRIGLIALPYYVVFDLLAPLLELLGLVLVPLGLLLGVVDVGFAVWFLVFAYGYGFVVSLAALAVEEFSFRRYPRWIDLATAMGAAIVENCGYRQFTAVWRLQGWWGALRGRQAVWGEMARQGFGGLRPAGELVGASGKTAA